MFKKNACKLMILSIFLVIPLMLGITSKALANGPEPPGAEEVYIEDIEMRGELSIVWGRGPDGAVPELGYGFWAAFVGNCFNKNSPDGPVFPITVPPTFYYADPVKFPNQTPETIMEYIFEEVGPATCFDGETPDVRITNVGRFHNTGVTINANVTIQGLQ